MSRSVDNVLFYVALLVQLVIGALLLRFVSLWLGYDAYVPYIDDLYSYLVGLLEKIANQGLRLVPGIF